MRLTDGEKRAIRAYGVAKSLWSGGGYDYEMWERYYELEREASKAVNRDGSWDIRDAMARRVHDGKVAERWVRRYCPL